MSVDFPRLGALAVVVHADRVLLVRRSNPPDAGKWGFPGGHVEAGETAMQAAIRELREETGVSARPIRYLTNVDVIRRDANGDLVYHFLLAAVLCDYRNGRPQAADDAQDAAWIDLDDVIELDRSDRVDDVLALAAHGKDGAWSLP